MERWKFVFYTGLAFLLLPIFWVKIFLKRRNLLASDRQLKILVIPIMTRIGDLVCATPVFRALKIHRPNCHLSVLAGKKAMGIIKNNPRVNEIININDVPFKGFWGRGRFFKFIADQKFDWVISLTNNPFNNLAAFYSFAPYRVKTIRQARSFLERLLDYFNTYRLLYEDHTFLQNHYLKLLKFIGVEESEPVKEVFYSPGGEQRARDFLSINNIAPEDYLVGISVSAGNKIKEWPLDRFAELADQLIQRFGAKVVFIDAPANRPAVDKTVRMMQNKKGVFTATDFSIEEVPSFIKTLKLFISVDSGLIYVAHAIGVPLIDIIGPVDPLEQPPSDKKSIQVLPLPHIKPSSFVLAKPGKPENHKKAVESIKALDVIGAVEKLR